MLSIKLLDDYIIKEGDIKPFKIQLLRDMQPSPIPNDCTATVIIADKKNVLYEEPLTVLDAEQGIVQFVFRANIGNGTFDCEFLVTNNNDVHLTYPDNSYTQLKITASLSGRPEASITVTEYAKLNARIDDLEELIVTGGSGDVSLDSYVKDDELEQVLTTKQDTLVSGTNIKTINGTSILGSGNITIEGGTGGNVDLSDYVTNSKLTTELNKKANTSHTHSEYATPTQVNAKQDKLVSGTNIKTINGTSILGSGNITIEGGSNNSVDLSSYATKTELANKADKTEITTLQTIINDLIARIETLENEIFLTVKPEGTEVTLTNISATYNGGNVAVGTNVNSLTGITVTATYSDGSKKTVSGYTLSGAIKEGSNTITVTYQGKTSTFAVTGIANSEPDPEPVQYTLTINATPSDATVKINNVVQKTITVTEGTSVTYEVSKTGYVTQSGNKTVNATETLNITLVEEQTGGDTGGGDDSGNTGGGTTGDVVTIATVDDYTIDAFIRANGTISEHTGYHATDYIDVSNYSSVTVSALLKTTSVASVTWYDADKVYISGETETTYATYSSYTKVVPEGAVYARFSSNKPKTESDKDPIVTAIVK